MKLALLLILFPWFAIGNLWADGFLHRSGRYIADGSGREVILRGIGTGNWMLQEGYMMQTSGVAGTQHEFRTKLKAVIGEENTNLFYDRWLASHFQRTDVDSMKAWGFNSIRVALHYKWFTPPVEEEPEAGKITWLEKGFTLLDSLVDWCSDREMYLILDLHGAPGGQGKEASISDYDPSKPSLWESQANKDKTIALWRKLAERYSQEPWIGGYDLINETNWTFAEGNNSRLRELMVNITKAIREVDTNHLLFIEGNSFANDFSGLTPPWDANMAYSFHKYWNYNTQESISFATNLRNTHNVPIWLGESGENSNGWFTSLIALCEKNRIGWSWWPVKKPGINNPLKVTVNSDYTRLVNFWKGSAANPGAGAALAAVLQFADNHRIENCSFQKDVVDAMIRQPHTTETLPFRVYRTGEPVFAVDYNLGRSGYAYLDQDSADYHGSTGTYTDWNRGWSYRNDGVDIEPCLDAALTNGFNVGWSENREWMEYTVVSDTAAAFTLQIRSASGSGGSKVHLEVNGVAATPVISLPGTSGWQRWQTTTANEVLLPRGINKIKVRFDQGGSNLNYFRFSDPVSADSIPFRFLVAETSVDGKSILLTLNKPVTSPSGTLDPAAFTVTCDNQPAEVVSVIPGIGSRQQLTLALSGDLYYGATIRLSFQGTALLSDGQLLEPFTNAPVTNLLPVRITLPAKIEAEDFAFNNGLVSESCSDTGGGLDMGYAAPGDYLDYRVYVPKEGTYSVHVRVATIRASSQLILRTVEGNNYYDIDTLTIESTGGWQTWKTVSTKAFFKQGRYTLRLYVRSGEFNTNWLQVATIPVDATLIPLNQELKVYPNPANKYVLIDFSGLPNGNYTLFIYDARGVRVKSIRPITTPLTRMAVEDLPPGTYTVAAHTGCFPTVTCDLVIVRNN